MKKNSIVSAALAVILAILSVLSLSGCSNVTDAELQSFLPELIAKAAEYNEIIWGKGLEYVKNDETNRYRDVTDECNFRSTTALMNAFSEVYSADYMSLINETAFVGTDDVFARYNDGDDGILQVDSQNTGFNLRTTLHPESAKVLHTGFGLLRVSIPCEFDGEAADDYEVTLVKEDGKWKIDSPTY